MLLFDASTSELAAATGDGRVKIYSVAQQRLAADITQTLRGKATAGPSAEVYQSIEWGAQVGPPVHAITWQAKPGCAIMSCLQVTPSTDHYVQSTRSFIPLMLPSSSLQGQQGRLLFLGTTAGAVRCFDAARLRVKWNATAAVDSGIASLSCSPSQATLLVVGKSGQAATLDAATGSVLKRFKVGPWLCMRASATCR